MKQLLLLALVAAPLLASASQDVGCDAGCQRNVQAVFRSHTSYTMRIDDAPNAHVSVTWTPKHRPDLKPVTMVGVAPVRLRHTTLNGVEFADAVKDPCHAEITLLEQRGDDVDAYRVPVRNVVCHS
jgi:hypothetical protein